MEPVKGDVVVTRVEGDVLRTYGDSPMPVAVAVVEAVPYNSSNLIRSITFTQGADTAPRVGDRLSVIIVEEAS